MMLTYCGETYIPQEKQSLFDVKKEKYTD